MKIHLKTNLLILFVLLLINMNTAFCSNDIQKDKRVYSPDGKSYFFYQFDGSSYAKLFVYNDRIDKIVNIANMQLKFSIEDGIIWHNNGLLEINIKTGSPGNFSFFYSIIKDKVSDQYYFPLAVDSKKGFLLMAQEDVFVIDIFNPTHQYYIKKDFLSTAIKWLIFDKNETYFNKAGNLFIKYTNSKNEWVKEEIKSGEIRMNGVNPLN